MNDNDILGIQRALRKRLFEGPSAIKWRPGRELAAQVLLYLDDPRTCWRITTEWLRDTLDADRVDGGFGGFMAAGGAARDYVVMAEAQRDSMPLPSVLGLSFNAADPGLRTVWGDAGVAAIADVSQERSFTEDLRGALLSLGTAAKLALPVRDGARPVGLICADWHLETPRWNAQACHQLGDLARDALGPLLAAAGRICDVTAQESAVAAPDTATHPTRATGLPDLTPAELKVARLVVLGLSYKEVARQLDRSFSTVDHQLRSIRDKLGARSTARMVHILNEHLDRSPH